MRGALVWVLLAVPAYADNAPHKEGDYGGVTAGEAQPRDTPAKPAKPKHPPPNGTLTWIGFEAKDGGAQVFFQSVAPFDVTQRIEGAQLIVHLQLTKLGHNTWRQIDTRFFDNPLSGIVARAVGAVRPSKGHPGHPAGIEARIAFKNAKDAKEATVRTATEADGLYYTYLSFGEGTAGPDASTPASQVPDPDADAPDAAAAEAAPPADAPQVKDDEPPPAKPRKH
jgi:hypothetical protein